MYRIYHTYGTHYHADHVAYFRPDKSGKLVCASEWLVPGSWDEVDFNFEPARALIDRERYRKAKARQMEAQKEI